MIFIKKTDIKNVSDELRNSGFVPNERAEAFILANEEALQAICVYEVKKQYILIQKIVCPSQKPVYIDAVVRALLSSKLDEGYIYALISQAEQGVVKDTLMTMTNFQPMTAEQDYMVGILFDKNDVTAHSLYADIFKLFMHHKCSAKE